MGKRMKCPKCGATILARTIEDDKIVYRCAFTDKCGYIYLEIKSEEKQ